MYLTMVMLGLKNDECTQISSRCQSQRRTERYGDYQPNSLWSMMSQKVKRKRQIYIETPRGTVGRTVNSETGQIRNFEPKSYKHSCFKTTTS